MRLASIVLYVHMINHILTFLNVQAHPKQTDDRTVTDSKVSAATLTHNIEDLLKIVLVISMVGVPENEHG